MKIFIIILTFSVLLLISVNNSFAQVTGEPVPGFNPDTVFVFESPRPLVSVAPSERKYFNTSGFSLSLSGSGFGFGLFYTRSVTDALHIFSSFFLSGARNTDELEYYNQNTGETFIPGKIHRLYLLPLMFGLQYYPFKSEFDNTFNPYIRLGAGPSFIFANSYQVEYFKALGQMDTYTRFGAVAGIGAYFLGQGKSSMGFGLDYYTIPFGGNGLESIQNSPIYNFGGILVSMNFSIKF